LTPGQGAELEPTENYFLFQLAEKLGYTVGDLLQKMDNLEFRLWQRFYVARARLEHQQRKQQGKQR